MKPNGEIQDNTDIKGSDMATSSSTGARYTPTKEQRIARKRIWERYRAMADNPDRLEAELDWDMADKQARMWVPEQDPDDWRTNLILPDAFAAIQAEMQETIQRNSRPELLSTSNSADRQERETFCNAILNYSMDVTNFDMEYFKAKYAASIRGTAFLMDYYRVDRREIQDMDDVDAQGNIVYKKKTRIDFDDDYTEWVPNEFIFVDESVTHIDDARDMVRREILHIDEFQRVYSLRPDFLTNNVNLVRPGGDTNDKQFFKMPKDMENEDVEILHYYNRALDRYDVLANNVIIRTGPLPFKHKELPLAVIYHYMVPGRFWGMGVPKAIYALTEERRSIRMMNVDRQKMSLNKMFLVNDQVSLDDEDLITRPHGLIEVNTNGLPINNAIMPLEYGDVPSSYFQTEEILLEDIRRAHGIDDRVASGSTGGTAAEAAIMQQQSQRRINMIATIAEMDAMKRIGKLKWSNIQFFYPTGKVEEITSEENTEKPIYKKVKVNNQQFVITKDEKTKESRLALDDYDGSTIVELNKSWATFMGGDFDVVMGSEAHTIMSKAIRATKANELLAVVAQNPVLLQTLDPTKTVSQMLKVNDMTPKDWMKGTGMSSEKMQQLANDENMVMMNSVVLNGTPGATQEHTMVHLNFTESEAYAMAPHHVQQIIKNHILQEHDANPLTNTSAKAIAEAAKGAGDTPGGLPSVDMGANPGVAGPPGGAPGSAGPTGAPTPGAQPNLANQPVDLAAQAATQGQNDGNSPSPNPSGTMGQ